MSALTRRRDPDARQAAWVIHYGDVRVGAIAERTGNPTGTPCWQWTCGFYPGSRPGECTNGTAESFDQARAAFEVAWRAFLANRTESDFEECRRERARTAWKHTMWDSGCRLPTQVAEGRSRCFWAEISIADSRRHVYAAHMECRETA